MLYVYMGKCHNETPYFVQLMYANKIILRLSWQALLVVGNSPRALSFQHWLNHLKHGHSFAICSPNTLG
jgi:hypothetical protein